MGLHVQHRLMVEAVDALGEPIGDYPLVDVDFEPMVRSAHLSAMRRGSLAASTRVPDSRILPVACPERGEPYVSGFEVLLDGAEPCSFPISVLEDQISRESVALVEKELMLAGDRFDYRLCAYRFEDPLEATPVSGDGLVLDAAGGTLPVSDVRLPPDCRSSQAAMFGNDVPVLIRQHLIDEAVALSQAAGGLEAGGVLLGRLLREPELPDLVVEVTALLPAHGATSTRTSLHFSPEVFAEFERLLALRNETGEHMVGWYHSHPFFCRKCPQDSRDLCPFRTAFFSQADCDVHRTLFPQAYSLALLISDLGRAEPSVDLFSWRNGTIQHRGYLVSEAPAIPLNAPESTG